MCGGRILRLFGLKDVEQGLELSLAIGTALEMGADKVHPKCRIIAASYGLGELIQQRVRLLAVELIITSGLDRFAYQSERRGRQSLSFRLPTMKPPAKYIDHILHASHPWV